MEGGDGEGRTGTQAVDRALRVLGLLESAPEDLGVTSLAAASGLTVSTTHRLLKALAAAGLVAQDRVTERYHLGAGLVSLGRRAEERLELDRWHSALLHLAAETGESASLGTRVGNEVLIADHVPSAQPLRFDAGIGARVPIHASAMGKMFLALTADPVAEVAALGDLQRFTDRTRTDPVALLAELDQIRKRGWSLNDGERNPGVRAVAVALPSTPGGSPAAIAVQGPEVRLTDDRLGSMIALLDSTVRGGSPASSTA
jgi:IclR family transcriptional regulator, acetate operon repressor